MRMRLFLFGYMTCFWVMEILQLPIGIICRSIFSPSILKTRSLISGTCWTLSPDIRSLLSVSSAFVFFRLFFYLIYSHTFTFSKLDSTHFPMCVVQVKFVSAEGTDETESEVKPPFRITLPPPEASDPSMKRKGDPEGMELKKEKSVILVEPYTPPEPGPYPQDRPKQNSVRFTPTQVLHSFGHIYPIYSPSFLILQSPTFPSPCSS
jgi:hypothetical protein